MFANNDLPMLDVGFHHPQRSVGYYETPKILQADQPAYILTMDWALDDTVSLTGVFTWSDLNEELLKTTVHDTPSVAEEAYLALSQLYDGMTVSFRGNERGDIFYHVTRVAASPENEQLHIAAVKDVMTVGSVEIIHAPSAEQFHTAIEEFCFADPTTVIRGAVNHVLILQ